MPIKLLTEARNSTNGMLSVVKLNIPYTDETINVGVILQNSLTGEIKIKTIEDYKVFKNCFNINDLDNLEYSLNILNKRQLTMNSIFTGKISNSLCISEPSKYKLINNIEDEINNIFVNKVSINKSCIKKRNLNKYSKTVYISNIKKEIKEKQLDKIIKTRKHINTEFGEEKEISFVSYSDNNPIIVSQLISIYVDFWNNFNSALLLKYVNHNSIKEKVIYMPLTNGIIGLTDKINFVRDESRKEGFKLIDSIDTNEFIHYMQHKVQSNLIK